MDLKQLNAFMAIAKHQSFSTAAQTTGLSQPSLSRQLKQLETELNVILVNRYHRPLQLTSAGRFFYDKLRVVLTELDTITSMTQRLAAPSSTLNVGFVPSVLYGLLPEIIATLKQQSSDKTPTVSADIEVNLKDISSYQQIEALKSGEIDVGFSRFSHQDPWIQQILLRHERYMVALPKAHALAHVTEQRLIDLANNRLILYHQTHLPLSIAQQPTHSHHGSNPAHANHDPVTEPLLYLFAQQGITPYRVTTVSDLQIALGLVAAGEGITLVPASLQTVRTEQISYQRLIHENVTSPIYLHTLKDFIHPRIPDLLNAAYQVYERRGITYRREHFISPNHLSAL